MNGFIYGRNPNADTLDGLDSAAFALLAGRAGGQTLQGGTAANEDLTLEGTAHATKATSYVVLQPTGGYVGIATIPTTTMQLQIGPSMAIDGTNIANNVHYSGGWKRIANGYGIILDLANGALNMYAGVNGSAGTSISLTNIFAVSNLGAITIIGGIRPAVDGTAALTLCKANGDAVVTVDTTNSIVGTAGAMSFTEMTAPGAGAANTARIYAKDNGAGKTQLMVQFATGGEIQIAIEA